MAEHPLRIRCERLPDRPVLSAHAHVVLRPYQAAADAAVHALVAGGTRRVLVVAPTGAGKSVLIGFLAAHAARTGEGMVVLAHRQELIDQNLAKVLAAGVPPELVGVVMGGDPRRAPGAPIQIASVDTLRGWIGKRGLPRARWVITDEAHRAAAMSYRRIAEAYPDAVHVGYTATPWRLDGQGLADLYDEVVVVATIPELIAGGWLVPLRCYSHPRRPDLSKVHTRGGDFVEEDVVRAMGSLVLGDITEHWRRHAEGRATFGFAINLEEAIKYARACTEAGIPSVVVSSKSGDQARKAALADLRAGRVKIVWNVGLFTEGTDVEEVKAVILARPTLSHALAFQMIGRGMRPKPETGFADCVVLDHAGVLQIHGHPLDPQDYSLSTTWRRKAGAAPLVKDCPECQSTVALGCTLCPHCGHTWEREERQAPAQVAGQLVEVAPRPKVILSPSAEEDLCRKALRKAIDQEARNPIRYASAILERQLRRPPDKGIFERAVLQVLAKPKPEPPTEMPEWLKRSLGIPVIKQRPPAPAFVEPSAPVEEEIVEVSF